MPEARAGHRNGRVNPPPRPTHRHGNEVMDAASSALALQTPPPIEIAMATECEGRPLRRHQLRRPELTACPPTSTRSRSRSAILARTGRTSAYARSVTRAALTREGSRARCGRRSDRSPGGARRGSSHPRRGHARLRRANAASRVLARPGSIDRAPEPSRIKYEQNEDGASAGACSRRRWARPPGLGSKCARGRPIVATGRARRAACAS